MKLNPALFVPALNAGGNLWTPTGRGSNFSSLPDRSAPLAAPPLKVIAKGADITHLLNGTANASFPPGSWLGFGLDMTTVTPYEIRSFKSGDEAFQALSADTDAYARYYAVSGGVTAAYAVKKSLQKSYQYLMMAHNRVQVIVHFVDFEDAINERMLRRRLDRIPTFDPRNEEIVESYRNLFSSIGSHVITGLTYGDRFQLQTWADNGNAEVDQNFNADVSVEFNGLTTGGKVDAGINGTSEFTTFEGTVQKTYSVRGGDEKLATKLDANIYDAGVFKTYEAWVNTTGPNPRLHSFQTMTLWSLVSAANDSKVADRARDLELAYNWIVENPKQHVTKGVLTIASDWGEMDLLTPSAFLTKGEGVPEGVFLSKNKIQWNSHGAGAQILEIPLVDDDVDVCGMCLANFVWIGE
ncbi:MAG: hypothetical protein Q9169_002382 [Polycauliona sp. 2 TL-2023]